jgi:hypothetical protein
LHATLLKRKYRHLFSQKRRGKPSAAMKSEFDRGWRAVVSGAVGMGTGIGLYFMLNSVFVIPLSEEFGWERSEMALSNVIGLGALVLLPFLGAVVDRFDARRVGLVGFFLLGG